MSLKSSDSLLHGKQKCIDLNLKKGIGIGVDHTPFNATLWTGRNEPYESERACYWYQVVQDATVNTAPARISIIGFACDQGVRRNLGRVGAKDAPQAIRHAFAKLPISRALQDKYDTETRKSLVADVGDIVCHDNDTLVPEILEQTQAKYSEQVTKVIGEGGFVIGLGGGHAIAYASYLGLWHALNKTIPEYTSQIRRSSRLPKIGIINFDAHLDLRQAPSGTSGTPFRQIAEHIQSYNHTHHQTFHYCAIGISQFSNTAALFDRASELGAMIISDDDCSRQPWTAIEQQLDKFIGNIDILYLTIDMDGFSASCVPGVSAPAAKGMSVDFVERCLGHIFASGKVTVADIAEINPAYDIDGRSSKVAARLLALMIEHYLLLD